MNGPLVIVGCGAGKVDHPARPGELYTGQHYRACLSTALAIVPASWVRILSAKHGLLRLDGELVDPYDLTLGQPGAITAAELAEQAAALGELGRPVVALCGKRYAALIGAVWSEVAYPLDVGGIGHQRHALSVLRASGRPPQSGRII